MPAPGVDVARRLILDWYREGLLAVDPRLAVANTVSWDGSALHVGGRIVGVPASAAIQAVAVGKAAAGMAHGLEATLGSRLASKIILTKDGHAMDAPPGWEVFEARHPIPDQRGVDATREIVDEFSSLGSGDVAIVLISGGGSALLEMPRPPLELTHIQVTTDLLLRAGAPIQHLNAVRSELSDVKGGGLRRAVGAATCVSLILSDVLGNDPGVIASGPTILREPDPGLALDLLASYDLTDDVPSEVIDSLRRGRESTKRFEAGEDVYFVIGDNRLMLARIEDAARAGGFHPRVVLRDADGEARDLANRFVDLVLTEQEDIDVVLGGGEATVTVRGDGKGGRNTEFALAAALRLAADQAGWVIASLASDGQDGSVDAAGAIVDRDTVSRGMSNGLDAVSRLEANDSGTYFESIGGLVAPGPTGTNVNDVYIAICVDTNGETG